VLPANVPAGQAASAEGRHRVGTDEVQHRKSTDVGPGGMQRGRIGHGGNLDQGQRRGRDAVPLKTLHPGFGLGTRPGHEQQRRCR
jgi:hypothetical protein